MSVDLDLLRRAWPNGYLAMRGVSTVGHELFRGSMKHSDDPILLGIRFCEAIADSYRYGEQSGSPDDEVMLHLWVAGELLPNVDPADAATWACLEMDLALAIQETAPACYEVEPGNDLSFFCYGPMPQDPARHRYHLTRRDGWIYEFRLPTTDLATALVLARIELREREDR